MSVKRIYVEKKPEFAAEAEGLLSDIRDYLKIPVENVRIFHRYDCENVSDEVFETACTSVFSEPQVDDFYLKDPCPSDAGFILRVEYVMGQFDQRADSAEQCIALISGETESRVRYACVYAFFGSFSSEDKEKITKLLVNPVDQKIAEAEIPATLTGDFKKPENVEILEGFTELSRDGLKDMHKELGLAMTIPDLCMVQKYFIKDEGRNPTITEIKVIDTYWSDHCRHTTFATELKKIKVESGFYKDAIERALREYLRDRLKVYGERPDKYVSLMNMATLAAGKLEASGELKDKEDTDEINACSVIVPILVDGQEEEWIVSFKNETHNHPTEIEPFGGAATCLGGAIRDPLSGRGYVYQAMRITGCADPTTSLEDTISGKLPQREIAVKAAAGYSSYGNQIGLATGLVKEVYHPDFVAKHMELGAVIAAAPRKNVVREAAKAGNVVILLGGRTGRDGIGGATGSSKSHTEESLNLCGAEVQKGNPPTERKIQRLFRRPEVSLLIRRCNDFGAGGVAVAIGELADGVDIDLDKIIKKYEGLDGTELALSESQERMAVVVDKADVDKFLSFAAEENLEAVAVADITNEARLVMKWRGKKIVDISRDFLSTNGVRNKADVLITSPDRESSPFKGKTPASFKEGVLSAVSDLNECSQRGLVERFDSSIGAGTVLMPYGGKRQKTEIQAMVSKIPAEGETTAVSVMAHGYDPYLSSWSPMHGGVYAVIESVSKAVAVGVDYKKLHLSLQEYFGKTTDDPKTWGLPAAALLGAYSAQNGLGIAAIGGKDSMSGTFKDINVPPTLVSFAVGVTENERVITPELKKAGNLLVKVELKKDDYDLPVFERAKDVYKDIYRHIGGGVIVSAYVADRLGIAGGISKMAMGSGLGVEFDKNLDLSEVFKPSFGEFIVEIPADMEDVLSRQGSWDRRVIGRVIDEPEFRYNGEVVSLSDIEEAWESPLRSVYPQKSHRQEKTLPGGLESDFKAESIYICKEKCKNPTVFIPVFPGTNCEYDLERSFKKAGANVDIKIFKNLTADDIKESVGVFREAISNAQILMLPGGFSGGDEPEGSAKFFAAAFRNQAIAEAVEDLIDKRDGLALGICNGFQALIKLGLLPDGKISVRNEDSPTLTFNTINRHISKMVHIRVTSDKSPWLKNAGLGKVYTQPVSHGEGRFTAKDFVIKDLFENGQLATRYCDPEGNVTMDETYNVNGSVSAIEGITSKDGRIYGKMAHAERTGEDIAKNIPGEWDMKLFESGVEYFS